MILDKLGTMSDKQALTVTAASTNTIDLGVSGTPVGAVNPIQRDLGKGNKIPLLVQVTKTFVGPTSITIAMQTDSVEAFSAPVTLTSQTFLLADLKAGARMGLPVVPYGVTKRYLRMYYTVSGSATAGEITAAITFGNDETLPF